MTMADMAHMGGMDHGQMQGMEPPAAKNEPAPEASAGAATSSSR